MRIPHGYVSQVCQGCQERACGAYLGAYLEIAERGNSTATTRSVSRERLARDRGRADFLSSPLYPLYRGQENFFVDEDLLVTRHAVLSPPLDGLLDLV
jgi:hypothetical protein